MSHPTDQQLQELADGLRAAPVELHLRSCPSCRQRVERLHDFERALRSLPVDHLSPDFTQRVMKQIGIRESATFGWSIVRGLAPFLALMIVLGLLVGVMKYFGSGSSVTESVGQTQSMASTAAAKVSAALGAATQWTQKLLPFAFAKQSSGMTAFILLFLGFVGLLDRFVIAPFFRKRA